MIRLFVVSKFEEHLRKNMAIHYSHPKGFVGRSICYAIYCGDQFFGNIVGGSATLHLPGRNEFFKITKNNLNNIVNNIFYHIEKVNGEYPLRWFTAKCLAEFRKIITIDWKNKYGDDVIGFESLVELPRTGDCYKKDKWTLVGQTVGYTCKRGCGKGTDSWGGKRVWDTQNLKPKLVFCKKNDWLSV